MQGHSPLNGVSAGFIHKSGSCRSAEGSERSEFNAGPIE